VDTAINLALTQGVGIVEAVEASQASALFALLDQFPLAGTISVAVMVLIVLWFVSGADAGAVVMGILCSRGSANPPAAGHRFLGNQRSGGGRGPVVGWRFDRAAADDGRDVRAVHGRHGDPDSGHAETAARGAAAGDSGPGDGCRRGSAEPSTGRHRPADPRKDADYRRGCQGLSGRTRLLRFVALELYGGAAGQAVGGAGAASESVSAKGRDAPLPSAAYIEAIR
jgi:hypothetical protein